MLVKKDKLVKILYRKYKDIYSREQIAEIIERDGANSLDSNIEYLGFGYWQITK